MAPRPRFVVTLAPSRAWLGWVAVSGCVAALLLATALSPLLLLLLPWPLWRALAADGRFGAPRLEHMAVAGETVRIRYGGCDGEAAVLGASIVWPWLVLLHLERCGQRIVCPVFPDSAPADARRRLRVWLRWCAPACQPF